MFSENQGFSPFGWSDPTFLLRILLVRFFSPSVSATPRRWFQRRAGREEWQSWEAWKAWEVRWQVGFSGRILMITCETWGLDHETWPLVGVWFKSHEETRISGVTLGPECPVSRKVARTMGHMHLFFYLLLLPLVWSLFKQNSERNYRFIVIFDSSTDKDGAFTQQNGAVTTEWWLNLHIPCTLANPTGIRQATQPSLWVLMSKYQLGIMVYIYNIPIKREITLRTGWLLNRDGHTISHSCLGKLFRMAYQTNLLCSRKDIPEGVSCGISWPVVPRLLTVDPKIRVNPWVTVGENRCFFLGYPRSTRRWWDDSFGLKPSNFKCAIHHGYFEELRFCSSKVQFQGGVS